MICAWRLENEFKSDIGTKAPIATAAATIDTPRSGLRRNATLTVSWELTGSRAIALLHNLLLARRFVRREGIEPPTR